LRGRWLRGGDEDGGGDALGRGGFDGAGKDFATEDEGAVSVEACECGAVEYGLAAFTEEERFEAEAGADGLGDEVFAFEAEEFAGLRGLAAEGGTEGFHTGVGLARNGCGGWHRGEEQTARNPSVRADSQRIAESGFRRGEVDGIKSMLGKFYLER
jgi:hypothetical protein